LLWLAAFIATIPAANWMIGHVGTACPPGGPCLIRVAPGVMASSGVLMIGLALVLRDLVHRELGVKWAAGAIVGMRPPSWSPAARRSSVGVPGPRCTPALPAPTAAGGGGE
jgi:queuosine precursor transporter